MFTMTIRELHSALAWLGFTVDDRERLAESLGATTAAALAAFQAAERLPVSETPDVATEQLLRRRLAELEQLDRFEVRGTVRRRDGSPWRGAIVQAFDLDLRAARELGTTRTDERGAYTISYERERYTKFDAGGPDLVVRVQRAPNDSHERAAVLDPANALAHAGPRFNAAARATVDLVEGNVARAGSTTWDRLVRLITPVLGGAAAGTLDDRDAEFIEREAAVPRAEVRMFAAAWRLADEAQLRQRDIPAPAWFALRQRVVANTAIELATRTYRQAEEILRSAMGSVIPSEPDPWAARTARELAQLVVDLWEADGRGPLQLATIAMRDPGLAREFVERMIGHRGTMADLWRRLRTEPRFALHVPALARVMQLAGLTGRHLPLVDALEARMQRGSAAERLPDITDEEWDQLVARHGHPRAFANASEYTRAIKQTVERSFPSRYVAARLHRLPIEHSSEVAAVLRRVELHRAPVAKALTEHPRLAGVPGAVKREVARLQRLHRAVGSVDDLAVVMDRDLDSAGDIVRLGRSEVRRRFGADHTRADRVFERALAAHQEAAALWAKVRPEINRPLGDAVPKPFLPSNAEPLLAPLALDFCSCERCRSVLSPAAYLADLLALLDRAAPAKLYLYTTDGETPRREDIGAIKLDCPNTTTPLPYIDLVNEILEWHVVRRADQLEPPSHQTTWTRDELLVAPEHVTDAAYDDVLANAVHPWSLPFSLANEMASAHLAHFGLDRRTLAALAGTPELPEIAFGLTPADAATLFQPIAEPWRMWGLEETQTLSIPFTKDAKVMGWLDALSYGKYLRERSGLAQDRVLAILRGHRVTRENAIEPVWPEEYCDFDHARLPGFTARHAAAFHRHARLAMKLGWTLELVDVMLERLAPDGLAPTVLRELDGLVQLASRLGCPVVETLPLVGMLATRPDRAGEASHYAAVFLDARRNPDHRHQLRLVDGELTADAATVPHAVIASAAGLGERDLSTLFPSFTVDLASLSRTLRAAALLRATGLTAVELLAVDKLVKHRPAAGSWFAGTTTPELVAGFLDEVVAVRASGFSIGEVAALCAGSAGDPADAPVLDELHGALVTLGRREGWPPSKPLQRRFIANRLATTLQISDFACDALLDDTFLIEDESPFPQATWLAALARLRAYASLIRRLRLDDADLPKVLERWLAALPFPPAATHDARAVFARLLRLFRLVQLRDRVRAPKRSLWQALASGPSAVAEWAGVDAVGPAVAATPGALVDPVALARALDLAAAATKLGVDVTTVKAFAAHVISMPTARAIRETARAAQPPEAWPAVARPLQDKLRVRQRDALATYVCERLGRTPRELFDLFLIDVEMSDCQLTSRIQQAICSVQLYIQRIAMGLEKTETGVVISLDADTRREWDTWLGSYETWARARSVFLYPESTLDPALRRDKTEPFRAIEKKLEQADVTTEVGRDLMLEYLEHLDDLANLEPRAIYREPVPSGGSDADRPTHVISRSRETPHRYYHRALVEGRWTAWQKLDLDISEHLVMSVYKGRLFAYWVTFHDRADEFDKNGDSKTKRHDVVLSWSEYRSGKWLAARTARNRASMGTGNAHVLSVRSLHAVTSVEARLLNIAEAEAAPADDPWIIVGEWHEYQSASSTSVVWFHLLGWSGDIGVGTLIGKAFDLVAIKPPGVEAVDQGNVWVQTKTAVLKPNDDAILDSPTTRVVHGARFGVADSYYTPPFVIDTGQVNYAVFGTSGPDLLASDPTDGDVFELVHDPTTVGTTTAAAGTYRFEAFSHANTGRFIERLEAQPDPAAAVTALVSMGSQLERSLDPPMLAAVFHASHVQEPFPGETNELRLGKPFGVYNWELFFYLPLLISDRLRANQRFEESIAWLHLIFDPRQPDGSGTGTNDRWQFVPFRHLQELQIQELNALLSYDDPALAEARALLESHLEVWRRDPEDPHSVALHRPGAWMRAVTLRYVETLIAWGDHLFRRETIEALNQATLRYLLAGDILGARPRDLPSRKQIAMQSYEELRKAPLGELVNPLVEMENWVPPKKSFGGSKSISIPAGHTLYFCIPRNDKIDRYWDVIADRLFKVRNCLDISGRARQLFPFGGLFEQIAKASALGEGALADPLPPYRFTFLLGKAVELANDVQRLGGELLAALEKRDGEALAMLRSEHERAIAKAIHDVKTSQVDEAELQLEVLQRTRASAELRHEYYASRPFLNAGEAAHLATTRATLPLQEAAGALEQVTAILSLISDISAGSSTFLTIGGGGWSRSTEAVARGLRTHVANELNQAAIQQTLGGYQRRADDWGLQRDLAKIELEQLDRQLAAAELRVAIARRELKNHELQMQHLDEVADFLTSKFTSAELYGWMVERLGALHFQAYELANSQARRAQKTFQFERAETESFLQPAYFDKLRQGLLAGHHLLFDLRRMETAYLERNTREYEITKHVSLNRLSATKLFELRALGTCTFDMPEHLFDVDHPGHYLRRLKHVSVTIPAVVGPHAAVNATVTLVKSSWRAEPKPADFSTYTALPDAPSVPTMSIVTSSGQQDSGLFEPNLRDERYLPFEGAGAVSTWRIDLPLTTNALDRDSITDVILHLRYTAREGTYSTEELADLADVAVKEAKKATPPTRLFSIRHDFPSAWLAMVGGTSSTLTLDCRPFLRANSILHTVTVHLADVHSSTLSQVTLRINGLLSTKESLDRTISFSTLVHSNELTLEFSPNTPEFRNDLVNAHVFMAVSSTT